MVITRVGRWGRKRILLKITASVLLDLYILSPLSFYSNLIYYLATSHKSESLMQYVGCNFRRTLEIFVTLMYKNILVGRFNHLIVYEYLKQYMKVKQNVRLALLLIQNDLETRDGLRESVLPLCRGRRMR
jgi:hypothetical protein